MLYLIHFYFDVLDELDEEDVGQMACFLESDDINEAATKFREYIIELRESCDLLNEITAVYLDSIVEMKRGPNGTVTIYDWAPEEKIQSSRPVVNEPFLQFPPCVGETSETDEACGSRKHLRLIKSEPGGRKATADLKGDPGQHKRHLRLIQGHGGDRKLFR